MKRLEELSFRNEREVQASVVLLTNQILLQDSQQKPLVQIMDLAKASASHLNAVDKKHNHPTVGYANLFRELAGVVILLFTVKMGVS